MKKPKKIIVISAITISLLGAGAYIVSINNKAQATQQQINMGASTILVQKGDIKSVVSSGGKVSLIDENSKNPNAIQVKLSVNQYDISQLKIGQTVEIVSKAFPEDTMNAVIKNISNKAEEGPSYEVTAMLSNPILEIGESKNEETNIRKGPSKEYAKISKLEKGDKFKILERKGSWMRIRLEDNKEGWILKEGVKLDGIDKSDLPAQVSNNDVILRKSNSSKSKSLGKMLQGDDITIIDKKDNWYKVKTSDNTEGWLLESDITLQKLKDGMSITGTIIINEKKNIIKVPVMSVQKDEKGYFVIMSETNEKRYIEIGITDSEYIEVIKGLSEGESISVQSFIAPADNSEDTGSRGSDMVIGG